ncbi:MAG: SURF1 family protein [Hyphomicrobiaceae bacterium]|nr:MAG: SURF1 family protein [Hyphomicrobiaceae bacterium]
MLRRLRQAGLIWPTLLSILGLAVLLSLGTWQVQRKAWKDGLQARIAARAKAEPVPLSQVLQIWRETGDVEYLHVRLTGRFAHGREQHVYAIDERAGPGFHIYTPLEATARQLVLVNRGFVPSAMKEPSRRPAGQLAGEITLTGVVRLPVPRGMFTPKSEPDRNMFYWPDYMGMLSGARGAAEGDVAPVAFFVEADADPANPGGWPKGGVTRLMLSNRHLEYALTWYGLAATLIGVYFAFAAGRLRLLRA